MKPSRRIAKLFFLLGGAASLFGFQVSSRIPEAKAPGLVPKEKQADRVLVEKAARKLTLYRGDKVLKTYYVALGGAPVGAKEKQGDQKTPEGKYVLDSRNPASKFHLSLHVSYPDVADRARARKAGVDPGGAIMIHGIGQRVWLAGRHAPEKRLDAGLHRRDQRRN